GGADAREVRRFRDAALGPVLDVVGLDDLAAAAGDAAAAVTAFDQAAHLDRYHSLLAAVADGHVVAFPDGGDRAVAREVLRDRLGYRHAVREAAPQAGHVVADFEMEERAGAPEHVADPGAVAPVLGEDLAVVAHVLRGGCRTGDRLCEHLGVRGGCAV